MKSHKQDRLIAALLVHPTITAAAESIRISEKTARLWLADPAFMQRYRAERRRLVEGAVARMQQAMGYAVNALLLLLKDGNDTAKFNAAKIILEHGCHAVETADILERLESL